MPLCLSNDGQLMQLCLTAMAGRQWRSEMTHEHGCGWPQPVPALISTRKCLQAAKARAPQDSRRRSCPRNGSPPCDRPSRAVSASRCVAGAESDSAEATVATVSAHDALNMHHDTHSTHGATRTAHNKGSDLLLLAACRSKWNAEIVNSMMSIDVCNTGLAHELF